MIASAERIVKNDAGSRNLNPASSAGLGRTAFLRFRVLTSRYFLSNPQAASFNQAERFSGQRFKRIFSESIIRFFAF